MAPEASINGNPKDTDDFLQDLKDRFRQLYELDRQLNAPLGQRGEDSERPILIERVCEGIR